jgi:hypothetical protein
MLASGTACRSISFGIVQSIAPIKAGSEWVGKSSYSLGLKVRHKAPRGFTLLWLGFNDPRA